MKRQVTNYECDVCGREFPESQYGKSSGMVNIPAIDTYTHFPVIFTTEQEEGRPTNPYISYEKLDICKDCIIKSLRLRASGAQGNNTYHFEKEDK